ncbi:MAG TPA: SpvB/TcaC N-terminal domain-containing protein, partial [Polyangiaceae bacterium]|nr:SpvB/TcaC N-terminal domain-containing protein [Polyangiaceae bacterium]
MSRRIPRFFAALVCAVSISAAAAAQASGTESTKISLPTGPASIEGLGKNFSASLASGTASYGIDIAVPPAAGGFAPHLSLDYDGGGGVSELGLGWHLGGLLSVRRRVDQGLPRFDATDTFELSGAGVPSDLLEMPDGFFRAQYESGGFFRVQRTADGGRWEARAKSGVTYRFGGKGFTEEEDGRVVTYLLREQVDLHGHTINYEWDTSEGRALLSSVTWNDFSDSTR